MENTLVEAMNLIKNEKVIEFRKNNRLFFEVILLIISALAFTFLYVAFYFKFDSLIFFGGVVGFIFLVCFIIDFLLLMHRVIPQAIYWIKRGRKYSKVMNNLSPSEREVVFKLFDVETKQSIINSNRATLKKLEEKKIIKIIMRIKTHSIYNTAGIYILKKGADEYVKKMHMKEKYSER